MRRVFIAISLALALAASPALAADIVGVPRIVDGDTVEIAGTKVRLNGIDAPEADQVCLDARGRRWTCGVSARDALAARYGGKTWTCRPKEMDLYGRTVASCAADGEDVDRWMVRAGWAMSFVRYDRAYVADEKAAQDARAGLWAGAFIAPWDWRSRSTSSLVHGAVSVPVSAQAVLLGSAPASEAPNPSCAIKGNVKDDGSCIFHVPGGRWYAKVHMTAGKRWFCSTAQAEAAGCRAAVE